MRLGTLLFAPADQARKVAKAFASPADMVILDLEDSIAQDGKAAARDAAVAALAGCDLSRAIVRINPLASACSLADLVAIIPARPAAVMLPKCAGVADLVRLDHQIEALEEAAAIGRGAIGVLALATESAHAAKTLDYSFAPARLRALCFGAEDLSADLGISPRAADGVYPAPIAVARANLLLAAAQAGVPAIDTPWPAIRDAAGLEREARAAAVDGFAGKLCIHPDQLAAVAAAFAPSVEQLEWARAVREAFAAQPAAGVLSLHGQMIDKPHLRLAERLLAAAATTEDAAARPDGRC